MAQKKISKDYFSPSPALGGNTSKSPGIASINLSDGNNYVFYYDDSNRLACLQGQDGQTYSTNSVQLNNVSITANNDLSPLAATAWVKDSQRKEIRLYYVDSNFYIKELCSADGKAWRSGDFDKKNFKAASRSSLTATFGDDQSLKVFFVDANNTDYLTEAYIKLGGTWQSKILN